MLTGVPNYPFVHWQHRWWAGGCNTQCRLFQFSPLQNVRDEAKGCVLHELCHVVQNYRASEVVQPQGSTPPAWLVEGIPDYIRWFLYEPQSHGADAVYFAWNGSANLNYDGLYRVSANFLNYVIQNYDPGTNLLASLNAACREGKYRGEFWKGHTGKTLPTLNNEWKAALHKEIAAQPVKPRELLNKLKAALPK